MLFKVNPSLTYGNTQLVDVAVLIDEADAPILPPLPPPQKNAPYVSKARARGRFFLGGEGGRRRRRRMTFARRRS